MQPGIPEPETVAKTLRRHRAGIPDGYRHDKTNELAEGPDNTIKLLKKRGYGNPTFTRMKRRCPSAPSHCKPSRNHVHLPQIDADGKAKAHKRGDSPASTSADE